MCPGAGQPTGIANEADCRDAFGSARRVMLPRGSSHISQSFLALPYEAFLLELPRFLDCAQPVARLACASRSLASDLQDSAGCLRVGSFVTCRLQTAVEALNRMSLSNLEVFRIDLSTESRSNICSKEIERVIRQLGHGLAGARALKVLAVRLASFDANIERVRVSREAWEALIRGLSALSQHQTLRTLELSSITIKASRATQDVSISYEERPEVVAATTSRQLRRAASSPTRGAGAAAAASATSRGKLTFLEVLEKLTNLEELVLTYDEIFKDTAQMLPPVFNKMEHLKKVDLTRNHIPKQVMQTVRAAMCKKVQLCGDDSQTFFFY